MVEGGLGGGALTGDGGEQFVCAQCGGAANQRYYLYSIKSKIKIIFI